MTALSPAEAYARARARATPQQRRIAAFTETLGFRLDQFQAEALAAIAEGRSVLVAAPTGAGKTVVGEFAVDCAVTAGRRAAYTTPIKALSNQKYGELVRRYGAEGVGLLTGDTSLNPDAPVVVMTTEVLRNMLYRQAPALVDFDWVIMDEVHYLADRARGAVWEEVIILLDRRTRIVALSATVSNAEEFGAWLQQVRGETTVIVDEVRPVPLWQHVAVGEEIHDLFLDPTEDGAPGTVNPVLVRLAEQEHRRARHDRPGRRGRGPVRRRTAHPTSRLDICRSLIEADLLPVIVFIFSRRGCEQAVGQVLRGRLPLTTPAERERIATIVDERTGHLPDADLAALEWAYWREGLLAGVAAHHAGMLPLFKEVVEALFAQGLVKVVFATETLALGINMPARAVVLESLRKWNGHGHVDLTPGEYTQLTGRAGRRGIDDEGHAVVAWSGDLDPHSLAGLASTRTYPLVSSFRPSYTMAVGLLERLGYEGSMSVLETSFAQFQADRSVVGLSTELRRGSEAITGYRQAAACHLGDIGEYDRLRRELTAAEGRAHAEDTAREREHASSVLAQLRPGDVVVLRGPRRTGEALVVSRGGAGEVGVLLRSGKLTRLSLADASYMLLPGRRVPLGERFDPRRPVDRTALLRRWTPGGNGPADRGRAGGVRPEVAAQRAALRRHPCHGCEDREAHLRWLRRIESGEREAAVLQRRIQDRTHTIARQFARVVGVLTELGYLEPSREPTPRGRLLAGLHCEADLLTAEAIATGLFDPCAPAELAAVASCLVYESREADANGSPSVPAGPVGIAVAGLIALAGTLATIERAHGVPASRSPDAGFAWAVYRWARGTSLEQVLTREECAAGDFVRWVNQTIDLLDQIRAVAPGPLSGRAAEAIALLDRGVVTYASGV